MTPNYIKKLILLSNELEEMTKEYFDFNIENTKISKDRYDNEVAYIAKVNQLIGVISALDEE